MRHIKIYKTSDAIKTLYNFMTDSALNRPEVSVGEPNSMRTITHDALPSYDKFRKLCDGKLLVGVAAFDAADKERVNVSYLRGRLITVVYRMRNKKLRKELMERILV